MDRVASQLFKELVAKCETTPKTGTHSDCYSIFFVFCCHDFSIVAAVVVVVALFLFVVNL